MKVGGRKVLANNGYVCSKRGRKYLFIHQSALSLVCDLIKLSCVVRGTGMGM